MSSEMRVGNQVDAENQGGNMTPGEVVQAEGQAVVHHQHELAARIAVASSVSLEEAEQPNPFTQCTNFYDGVEVYVQLQQNSTPEKRAQTYTQWMAFKTSLDASVHR